MYLPTKEVVARLNVGPAVGVARKLLVFQIAYNVVLAAQRAEALRLQGYEVVSVFGNDAAKVILSLPQHCDFFILGHTAPELVRQEMAAWLRTKYPGVPILALNRPTIYELPGADYNVKLNGPETWLPVIAAALEQRHPGDTLGSP